MLRLTWTAVNPTPKSSGSWDSIHVFDAQDRARTAHYKLTSTVILSLGTDSEALGGLDLSGNMVRQVEADMAVDDDTSHVANIGKMVEDMELKMRNLLQEVYFGKAKDVVGDLRSMDLMMQCKIFADSSRRYSSTQPDQQGQGDTEGDDQQHGQIVACVIRARHRYMDPNNSNGALKAGVADRDCYLVNDEC
jgi:hypothetical protein